MRNRCPLDLRCASLARFPQVICGLLRNPQVGAPPVLHPQPAFEAQRHFGILDARLAKQKYMLGDTYTIVDMAVWGWARLMPNVLGENAWAKFPNLKRLVDEISARPAAARAVALKDKHKFKTEYDDEAKKNMFRHLSEKVA